MLQIECIQKDLFSLKEIRASVRSSGMVDSNESSRRCQITEKIENNRRDQEEKYFQLTSQQHRKGSWGRHTHQLRKRENTPEFILGAEAEEKEITSVHMEAECQENDC